MPRLGELEREVMEQLWATQTPRTVRDIHDALTRERDLAYTTVMTVLDRLTRKGLVHRQRDGKAFRYSPASSRDELTAELMREALDDAGEDSTTALVHFAETVTPAEAAALRRALARLHRSAARRPPDQKRR